MAGIMVGMADGIGDGDGTAAGIAGDGVRDTGFAPVYHCWWTPWGRRCGV